MRTVKSYRINEMVSALTDDELAMRLVVVDADLDRLGFPSGTDRFRHLRPFMALSPTKPRARGFLIQSLGGTSINMATEFAGME
jgi:hypothetical protein